MQKKEKVKVFPVRVEDEIHQKIETALARSILKSKHQWIERAIAEKLERDNRAV